MGWTEERVEVLKKLWADGLSASQIAGRLGEVTRNAVIGKVHRLGLAGRATTSRSHHAGPRRRISNLPSLPRVHRTHGNAALKAIPATLQFSPAAGLVHAVVEELNIPSALRVDLLDLKKCMCRWPIGDPKDADFHFCGRPQEAGISYCGHHARFAFTTVRRRRSGRVLPTVVPRQMKHRKQSQWLA